MIGRRERNFSRNSLMIFSRYPNPAVNTLGQYLNLKEATSQVRVLDIATGSGVWGIALAQQSEHVQVSAVDWPIVLEVTRQMTARFGLTGRFEFWRVTFSRSSFLRDVTWRHWATFCTAKGKHAVGRS